MGLRVTLVNLVYGAELSDPSALLARYQDLPGVAAGLRACGAEVSLVQRFGRDVTWTDEQATWRFVAEGRAGRVGLLRLCPRVARAVAETRPDIIHLHGLLHPLQAWELKRRVPSAALWVQDHAGRLGRWPKRLLQRWFLPAVDGFLFAGTDLAQPFVRAGIIRDASRVHAVMEGSTHFTPGPRDAARQLTGLRGDPALLWVGHLRALKDPLTVLAGLAPVLAEHPSARLSMVYATAPMVAEVEAALAAQPALAAQVDLLGKLPHERMEAVYRSADIFVLGSHQEGSGYALAEAMACGLAPLVTDIPSFRWMTAGAVGRLWTPGDAASLTQAARALLSEDLAAAGQAARQQFESRLSFAAIGADLTRLYQSGLAGSTRR